MTASISPAAESSIQIPPVTGGSKIEIKSTQEHEADAKQARAGAKEAAQAQQAEIRKSDLGPGAGRRIDISA